ncbi:MAG: dihydroneopterin aldolase [Campylobacterales bacterium]|nr:dihydroneopterin aldolase [Campylobacterales bacterium]
MTICIKQLTFEAIIGLLPFERQTPQRVIVDITMKYRYNNKHFIDYATVAQKVEEIIKTERFELLEEAVVTIEAHLMAQYQTLLEEFTIEIQKPDILANCTVSLSKTKVLTHA